MIETSNRTNPHRLDFMESLIFRDGKRSVTVELLQRLYLSATAQDAGLGTHWKSIQCVDYSNL